MNLIVGMKFSVSFIALCAFISFEAFSLVKLNVETLMKNYIDEGLVLSTEFNASKIIEEDMDSVFQLGEKLEFRVRVKFEEDILNSGPSDLLSLGGKLIYHGSLKKMTFDLDRRKLRLGKKEAYFIQIEKDRKLEIYFMPAIKGFNIGN